MYHPQIGKEYHPCRHPDNRLKLAKLINIQRPHRQLPTTHFSFFYFAFNSPLTAMTLVAEWSGYANHHKGLRVSNKKEILKMSDINPEIEPPKHR